MQVTERSKELLEFDLHVFLQSKRIQAGEQSAQPDFGRLGNVRAAQDSLIGRLGMLLLDPLGLAPLFLAFEQLEGWLEMVGELAPFMGIQAIHQGQQFRMLQTVVPEELPHVRPVLLLAVGPATAPARRQRFYSRRRWRAGACRDGSLRGPFWDAARGPDAGAGRSARDGSARVFP